MNEVKLSNAEFEALSPVSSFEGGCDALKICAGKLVVFDANAAYEHLNNYYALNCLDDDYLPTEAGARVSQVIERLADLVEF